MRSSRVSHLPSEGEPKLGQTVEALGLAAKLWHEFGDQKNTAAVRQLTEKLARSEGVKKERPEKGEGLRRLKQLEDEVAKLKAALDKRLGELKECAGPATFVFRSLTATR